MAISQYGTCGETGPPPAAVLFGLAPPLVTATNGDGLAGWLATWDGQIRYEVAQLHVTVSGDAAFAHSIDRMAGKRVDAPATDLWFRVTLGLGRSAGRWLITHEHQSVPFAMDGSDKALLDLTP
ncbi:MAG: YybH family protein [Nocardioidaceae bacterium]